MIVVPLKAIPAQTTQIVLAGQSCVIEVNQLEYGLFLNLYVNNQLIVASVICQNLNRIVRSAYLGLSGDLVFWDAQGAADPVYTGIGSRFFLLYLTAAELEGAG